MKLFISGILILLLVNTVIAQPLKNALPNEAGANAQKLKEINLMLEEYVNKKFIGAATAIIVRDGKIIYHTAVGKQGSRAATTDDIYRIASQTKAITSVAVMMLYEQGKFLLDDPVGKYIPEFAHTTVIDKFNAKDTTYTTVAAKRAVTIRDLLTHTSGIGYAQIGSKTANAIYYKNGIVGGIGVSKILLADKMKKLGSLPLMHQPGEKWTYGLNTDLLGYLVEVVSGLPLDEFFKQKIFTPLGMNDTWFYLPANKHNRLATLYTENKEKLVTPEMDSVEFNGTIYTNYPLMKGTYFSGGGGLSSTPLDYAIFLQMLLNGGTYNSTQILSKAAVRMMVSKQYNKLGWPDGEFGLGFKIYDDRSAALMSVSEGSYEWGGMFSTTYWVDPKEKITAQLYLNQWPQSYSEIHDKFKVLVYAALSKSYQ